MSHPVDSSASRHQWALVVPKATQRLTAVVLASQEGSSLFKPSRRSVKCAAARGVVVGSVASISSVSADSFLSAEHTGRIFGKKEYL